MPSKKNIVSNEVVEKKSRAKKTDTVIKSTKEAVSDTTKEAVSDTTKEVVSDTTKEAVTNSNNDEASNIQIAVKKTRVKKESDKIEKPAKAEKPVKVEKPAKAEKKTKKQLEIENIDNIKQIEIETKDELKSKIIKNKLENSNENEAVLDIDSLITDELFIQLKDDWVLLSKRIDELNILHDSLEAEKNVFINRMYKIIEDSLPKTENIIETKSSNSNIDKSSLIEKLMDDDSSDSSDSDDETNIINTNLISKKKTLLKKKLIDDDSDDDDSEEEED